MLDPFDVSFREHRLEELELCGTGCSVEGGHRPDGAVAERDPIVLIRELVELGHVPLPVEDLGQCCHLLIDALAHQLVSDLLDAPVLTALKDTGDEVGVFLLEVAEQLNREVTSGLGEQRLALMGAVVEVGGSPGLSGPPSLLARGDKPADLRAASCWRTALGVIASVLCEVVDRRFAPPLQRQKSVPLCR